MSKKQKPVILEMPPDEYDVKVLKQFDGISAAWSVKNNNNGESMSIRFNNERFFLDFCDIMNEAKEMYLKEK